MSLSSVSLAMSGSCRQVDICGSTSVVISRSFLVCVRARVSCTNTGSSQSEWALPKFSRIGVDGSPPVHHFTQW